MQTVFASLATNTYYTRVETAVAAGERAAELIEAEAPAALVGADLWLIRNDAAVELLGRSDTELMFTFSFRHPRKGETEMHLLRPGWELAR